MIAGNGRFPFLLSAAARRRGRRVVAIAIREEAAPELESAVDVLHWVGLGQLGRLIALFKEAGVRQAVMAGQVKHRQIFSGIVPDLKLLGVLARLATKNTDSLIGGVAAALADEGITLMSSTALLEEEMARAGAMTSHKPSAEQEKDIAYGRRIARALAGLDLGQTVAVRSQAAVALEAMEGTDEVIRRAGRLAGPGVTIVKVAKPGQDMRFDVPVVGPRTIEAMTEAHSQALAIEAGRTLLVDRPTFLERAEAAGIAVWGMTAEA